jgi:hypothetical protein
MTTTEWHEMNTCQDYSNHKIDVSKEFNVIFNIPKINFTSHCAGQIRQYREFQQ